MAKDSPHGTRHRYRSGCKCEKCRKAISREVLDRRVHTPEARAKRSRASLRFYARNRQKSLEKQRAYRQSPRGMAVRAAHRMKRKGTPFTESGVAFAQILLSDPCSYCGATSSVVDHIDPVARGGGGDYDNLTASCQACNSHKHAKPLLLYLHDRMAH